jgi:hypothetical protein
MTDTCPSHDRAGAWGKQHRLTSASDSRLPRFITTYAQAA